MEADADAVTAQMESIRQEVIQAPLISHAERLNEHSSLTKEFATDNIFGAQVRSLYEGPKHYQYIRYTRRDGNCFYRSAVFGLLQRCLRAPVRLQQLMEVLRSMREGVIRHFGEYADEFVDAVIELLQSIQRGTIATVSSLEKMYVGDEAPYYMMCFRMLISYYLRQHSDEYLPYIMGVGFDNVEDYCVAEVEPVDHESDNIQLAAFASCFQLPLRIESLHRSSNTTSEQSYCCDDGADVPIVLFYRPGHYDLLLQDASTEV